MTAHERASMALALLRAAMSSTRPSERQALEIARVLRRLAVLLAAVMMILSVVVAPAQAQTPLLAYLFVGQSNMTGVSAWPEWPAEPIADPRIVMWSLHNRARGEGPEPAHQPVYYDLFQSYAAYPHQGGMSLSLPFAQRIIERYPGVRIMLLTCVGTTYVGAMQPGMVGFETCVAMANEAQTRYGASIAGIVTYAGEADTGPTGTTPSTGTNWGPMYVNMVAGFRQRLGLPHLAAVNFELAWIDPVLVYNPALVVNWTTVEQQQHDVVNQLSDAAVIDPDSWAVLFDGLHSDTATNTRNGREAADAMIATDSARFMQGSGAPDHAGPTVTLPPLTPTPSPCSPRPPVIVEIVNLVSEATVTATATTPIQSVTFGTATNATHTAPAISGKTATFTAYRANTGAWSQPFTITDGCGPWPSLVGHGG